MDGKDAEIVKSLVCSLTLCERQVVVLRYGEHLTDREVAMVLGLSCPEVSRILEEVRERVTETLRQQAVLAA